MKKKKRKINPPEKFEAMALIKYTIVEENRCTGCVV